MIQIERYLLRTATTACVSGLVVLTGVVWVTQALRQIDLITSKGQTILLFLLITALALPSLVAFIAPVALFAGILYTLNKLNGDSELVVMAASGMSPARLLRPMALLSAAVFAVVAVLYIQVLPWSFGAIENLTTFIHADFIANFARPGAFSQLEQGSYSTFVSARPTGLFTECLCRTYVIRQRSRRILPRLEKRSIETGRVIFSCPRASCCGHSQPVTRRW